jgi:hypothetical protein
MKGSVLFPYCSSLPDFYGFHTLSLQIGLQAPRQFGVVMLWYSWIQVMLEMVCQLKE